MSKKKVEAVATVEEVVMLCLKEGMEVTISNAGSGCRITCRIIGSITYGCSVEGPYARMMFLILDSKEKLLSSLVKRI